METAMKRGAHKNGLCIFWSDKLASRELARADNFFFLRAFFDDVLIFRV